MLFYKQLWAIYRLKTYVFGRKSVKNRVLNWAEFGSGWIWHDGGF